MTEEKGLDAASADKIGEYVKHKGMSCTRVRFSGPRLTMYVILGGPELLERLQSDALLMSNARAKSGIEEMATLFTYLDAYGVIDKASVLRLSSHTVCSFYSNSSRSTSPSRAASTTTPASSTRPSQRRPHHPGSRPPPPPPLPPPLLLPQLRKRRAKSPLRKTTKRRWTSRLSEYPGLVANTCRFSKRGLSRP